MVQVVQVSGPRNGPRPRGHAPRGVAQGQGGTAPLAFGSAKSKRKGKKQKAKGQKRSYYLNAWNAFSPYHLALPRAVGEYTVTRGTKEIQTSSKLLIIGTWQYSADNGHAQATQTGAGRNWSDVVALGCSDLTKHPSESAWTPFKMPMLTTGLGSHAQCVPSACSVQIMNGNALQTTSGMVYIGKLKVQPQYAGDDVDTAQDISDNFVSYMAPRLCSAGKLAFKGVHVDSHPLNMNRLSDFTQIYKGFTGSVGAWPADLTPTGFTPIVIYNPNGISLNYLVCHEYRTRFELFNPASASHKYHSPSTDMEWSSLVKKATELGSGALDIADVVAKSGILQRVGAMFG